MNKKRKGNTTKVHSLFFLNDPDQSCAFLNKNVNVLAVAWKASNRYSEILNYTLQLTPHGKHAEKELKMFTTILLFQGQATYMNSQNANIMLLEFSGIMPGFCFIFGVHFLNRYGKTLPFPA